MPGRPVLADSARENVLLPAPAMPVTTTRRPTEIPSGVSFYRSEQLETVIQHQRILPDTGRTRSHPLYPVVGTLTTSSIVSPKVIVGWHSALCDALRIEPRDPDGDGDSKVGK